MSFSLFHTRLSQEKHLSLPSHLTQWDFWLRSLSSWPVVSHLTQVRSCLQVIMWCPYFWLFKHGSGFITYVSTFKQRKWEVGRTGSPNMSMIELVFIWRPSHWTVIFLTSIMPGAEKLPIFPILNRKGTTYYKSLDIKFRYSNRM